MLSGLLHPIEEITKLLPMLAIVVALAVAVVALSISFLEIDAWMNGDLGLVFSTRREYLWLAGIGLVFDFLCITGISSDFLIIPFYMLLAWSLVLELRRNRDNSVSLFVLVNIFLLGVVFQRSWWGLLFFLLCASVLIMLSRKTSSSSVDSTSNVDFVSTIIMTVIVTIAGIIGVIFASHMTPGFALWLVIIPFLLTQADTAATWLIKQQSTLC